PTQEENTPQTNNPAYVDTADFRLQAAQIRPRHKSLDPVAYTVVGGETLKDIARNVLGDASLWWRIAEANSLAVSGDGKLTAGQTLTVPKLSLNANSVETFQPYDPSQATGSMDPVLPVPANGGDCGVVGKIIMVVIAVVVTYLTAGAALNALGPVLSGALGGAAGSIASQAAGNLMGIQDGFSWKGVAMGAIGGGIAGGLASSSLLGGTGFTETVVRAAVGNAMGQGIGVVTGLQDRFDWRGVVASAVGAGVGWGMNEALGLTDINGRPTQMYDGVEKFARAGLSGFTAGTAAAVMRGGRISVQQVATDAFGNALGTSVADMMAPRDSLYSLSPTGARGLGMQAPAQWGTPSWTGYDQFIEAFRHPPQIIGGGVQIGANMGGGVILDSGTPANMPHVDLPRTYFTPVVPNVIPTLPEMSIRASEQPDELRSEVTVSGKQELMTREDFRVFELEYRNRTETLSGFDRNIYRAQGVYDAGKGMVESGLYSFGIAGTPESRAQWALQTAAATVQGIARLWNEPRAVFNEWRNDFTGNDPMKIRQASAQATGVGLGVLTGLRATRNLVVKMAEMPGPMAGSRAAQLGAVKIGGDVPNKPVASETRTAPAIAEDLIPITKAKFGHTFTNHGEGATEFLTGRARGTGMAMGQFLDDQMAARLIIENLGNLKNGAISIPIPEGFPARLIMPDGSYMPASSVRLVPSKTGVKTAYPEF
ncbi:LysM peptidoglycan-binding domain-containing protein, partial [Paracidovorax cattleyae]